MAEAMRYASAATAPLRPVRLGSSDVTVERRPDGTLYLRSPHKLEPYPDKITQRLEHWANAAPDRVFLAQRAADGSWRKLTYADALSQVRSVAQAL
jgi:feruloyl-CoA synthase